MAVTTPSGLIGKVTTTGAKSATVELLTSSDVKNRVSAKVQGKENAFGIINGYDSDTKLLELKQLPYDMKFKKRTESCYFWTRWKIPSRYLYRYN